jgi:hypothetical protein
MCAGFPDVCKTPAPPAPFAPIPYPNMAQVRDAVKTIAKVLVCNKEIVVENSNLSSSKGDEAGTMRGMLQPSGGGICEFLMGSMTVLASGKGVVVHLTPCSHNKKNLPAGGVHCGPSQQTVDAKK